MVVDDEPMNLVVAAGLFSDYGMSVDTSLSGKEAVNKYRDGDYDIVFMDHMMPEMDGVEAMKRIKKVADETGRSVVVIVLTANVVSGAKEMFAREGFDGFLSKPIYTKDYERIVSQLLSVRSAGREGDMA
ncbi:MAG: response regulator [Lachnospiraceae bacterium]|nr:response regulator [Lachnospiraceae bacterium]